MHRYGQINLRYAFIGKMKSMDCTSLSRNIQNTVGQGGLQGQTKTAYILAWLEKSNGMMVITWNWKLGVRCDGYIDKLMGSSMINFEMWSFIITNIDECMG